ncbi:nucleosome assembly protein 1;2 [Medicago truncatula]|nr:nucleosome assembly protein 1;2 [Medicago truncatula]
MANDNNNQMPSLEYPSVQDGGARVDLGEYFKNRIQDLAGQFSRVMGYLSLSPNPKKRVDFLRVIQREHDELKEKFLEERAALEAKYQLLYQPLFAKRYEIVNGLAEVEGVAMGTATDTAEEKGVPCFWLVALKNNEVVADVITDRDEEALKYLKDIKYTKMVEPLGFKLEFFFDPNPYFSNTVLTKTYHMLDEDEPLLERAFGTVINWLPEKSLTKIANEKQKNDLKNVEPVIDTPPCESFFNFFDPPEIPENDVDIDEDACYELQDVMERDYDIGSTIRDKIIPHAVVWFTGEAVDGEGDEDDDMYDDLDDGEV